MTQDEINIKVYQIKRFGYYTKKQGIDNIDNINQIFRDIKQWINGRPISDNCTFDDAITEEIDPTYCVNVHFTSKNDDIVFIMWHAVDVADGNNVAGIDKTKFPDNAKFTSRKFGDSFIPGYPSYYYINPEHKLWVPIKFNNGKNKIKSAALYLDQYLAKKSSQCQFSDPTDPLKVTHYGNTDVPLGYLPSIKYTSWDKLDKLAEIKRRSKKIEKVIRKQTVVPPDSPTFFDALFDFMGITSASADAPTETAVKYEVDYTPDDSEIDQMYEFYKKHLSDGSDIGFKIGSEVLWFGHSLIKASYGANIKKNAQGIYSGGSIMNFMQEHRNEIIKLSK